jgi:hypothetical protein
MIADFDDCGLQIVIADCGLIAGKQSAIDLEQSKISI